METIQSQLTGIFTFLINYQRMVKRSFGDVTEDDSVKREFMFETALKRNEINQAPATPATLEDLQIPERYRIYESTPGNIENFLLSDSGPGPQRILIFGRERNLQILENCDDYFVDGTFKIAPNLFHQVYVILAKRYGGVHPVFFALLPNKSRATYDCLFETIKTLAPALHPRSVTSDFELAAFKSLKNNFPQTEIRGCFFHLAKNMKKHLNEAHLIARYNNDAEFALHAKMIVGLAFVPMQDMENALNQLSDILPEELIPVLDWFEDFYVGRLNRRGNGRREPMFPHEMWNMYARVLNLQDRTNNHAEAAHRRLQIELGIDHPTIWRLIDGLRKVQANRDIYYEQLVAGHAPPQKHRRYIAADERILRIVRDYENRDVIEYLRGIAHNYQIN
ncbi:hypothetical protein PPYR_02653 [Photinus pyralis]|uniref:MULE transposase domain-containing protein n=1 Tax=Photinus pyralis TaxID=7054 RepID=A0A5N4AW44_PHOPY|nr:hypothetical protein PPYR_03768 [Photinus pyralis]KAB0805683.1 hypothetical protein PPYR_02653 [Photinus pyralis]